jgi:hypothetical protein
MSSTIRTQNQQMHADRYHTRISLEESLGGNIRRIRWFSDLQDAYIWVRNYAYEDDDHWRLHPFLRVCEELDTKWNNGGNGTLIAACGSHKFRAYYEPEATAAAAAATSTNTQRWPRPDIQELVRNAQIIAINGIPVQ